MALVVGTPEQEIVGGHGGDGEQSHHVLELPQGHGLSWGWVGEGLGQLNSPRIACIGS